MDHPFNSNLAYHKVHVSPQHYTVFFIHDLPEPIDDSDYIAFADDITQITYSPAKNVKAIANTTKHAIEQINNYENNWKIQTNTSKFTIIPITRLSTAPITINNNIIPYSNSGKILGLNISRRGFANQIKLRTAIALHNLNKLYRFKHLSIPNKKKLYTSLVRSALTYPIIPLHTANNSPLLKLQRVQNKSLRFIHNTLWHDFTTSEYLHTISNLPPINIFLHNSAQALWEKIQTTDPQLYNKLLLPDHLLHQQHSYFTSSHHKSQQPTPDPLYK